MRQAVILLSFFFSLSSFFLSNAQSKEDLIKEGDNAYTAFNKKLALEFYQKAEKSNPDDWEVLWRISRSYVDIAEDMPAGTDDQKNKQLAVFEKALGYADRGVKAASNQSVTYLRRAIANGKIALFKGVFSVAGVVNQVKADCEMAIKIGSGGNYVLGLAHYVLGRTHVKISEKWAPARTVIGLGWADLETGIKELKKATELYPDFRMFYFDLAKAYVENDEYDKAKAALKKLMNSPVKHEDDEAVLADAKALMNEIKDE